MSVAEKRVSAGLLAASLISVACASIMIASFQYVVVDMQSTFRFSADSANALTLIPLAASLLVVFLSGSLADRWQPRSVLIWASGLFTFGAVLVSCAPTLEFVVVGRVLDGIGGVAMAIVALSVINAEVTESRMRARVFSFYAAVTPVAFTLAPPITALLVEQLGWRAGMLPGILLGALALVMTLKFMSGKRGASAKAMKRDSAPELITPLLAGMVLAGIGLGVAAIPMSRALSTAALVSASVALVALIVLMARLPSPTLNLRWCRGRGMPLLLLVLAVAAMPNLFFYTNLLLQYRYGVSLLAISLLLVITQASAAMGGLLSGPVSARVGPAQAAAIGLLICGVLRLLPIFINSSSPAWVVVVALAVSSAPAAFLIGPVTNTLLLRAPREDSGTGASVSKATWTMGNVLGGAVIGSLTFAAFQSKLAEELRLDGMSFGEAQAFAGEIRDGGAVSQLAVSVTEPIAREDLLTQGTGLISAQAYAYSVMGLVSGIVTLMAGLLMVLYVRRTVTSVIDGEIN